MYDIFYTMFPLLIYDRACFDSTHYSVSVIVIIENIQLFIVFSNKSQYNILVSVFFCCALYQSDNM